MGLYRHPIILWIKTVQVLGSDDIEVSENSIELKLWHGKNQLPANIRFSHAYGSA
jgi:hypothetical protein